MVWCLTPQASIFSLLYILEITKMSFMKFSGDILNSLNFHAAEHITCFQDTQSTRQHHFEATKHLI
jgi:hypothetical protein